MTREKKTLKYEGLHLPENLNYILDQDFWMLDNVNRTALSLLETPIKFTSATSIYVRSGECKAEINLRRYDIKSPCILIVSAGQIMQPIEMSEDFEGAFIVMSDKLTGKLVEAIDNPELVAQFVEYPLFQIPQQKVQDFEMFFNVLRQIINSSSNQFKFQSVMHSMLAFFFNEAVGCLEEKKSDGMTTSRHITSQFLKLAQENFKKERFLDFYAEKMKITTKHLSRTVKSETGFTAGEWLDKMVLLEAKVLLKSSNMNVQQVAEELNFPSQSFFGKYFKNNVGISPKQFKNS